MDRTPFRCRFQQRGVPTPAFNPFDVSTKELVWDDPVACLNRFGVGPPGPVEVIDSDITALTASADKVLRVGGPNSYLVNIEFQSYHETDLVRTLWFRQVALDCRHNLPVVTVLVLLCKEANSPSLTGIYERKAPDGSVINRYNYRVVRIWKEDPESYLSAGVALVPLAPLADVKEESLPDLVQRMAPRINAEPPARAAKLWTATYLLMGLRYSGELATHILEGVANMQQSTTYQAILREGRKEGLNEGRLTGERQLLIRQGTKRFGPPDAEKVAAIEAIQDVNRLEALGERILEPNLQSWDDLLRSP